MRKKNGGKLLLKKPGKGHKNASFWVINSKHSPGKEKINSKEGGGK